MHPGDKNILNDGLWADCYCLRTRYWCCPKWQCWLLLYCFTQKRKEVTWCLELLDKEWRAKQRSLLGHCLNPCFSCILNTAWSSDSYMSNWTFLNHEMTKKFQNWYKEWKNTSVGRQIRWDGCVEPCVVQRKFQGVMRESKGVNSK